MKYKLVIVLSFWIATLCAQNTPSISIAYFGETITHPGIKANLHFSLHTWEKNKTRTNGKEKHWTQSYELQPSLGFYHHQDYQTGLFVLPQLAYTRKNAHGAYTALGLGAGYLRTFIPRVYTFENGEIEKQSGGYNYLLSNYFITLGKDLGTNGKSPVSIYCQPQAMYAVPNTKPAIWYFALEFGIKVKLK